LLPTDAIIIDMLYLSSTSDYIISTNCRFCGGKSGVGKTVYGNSLSMLWEEYL
jgi:hypothetical protein